MDILQQIAATAAAAPTRPRSRTRETIRQFTPNWFAATMGTGILSVALAQFPFPVPGLRLVAEGLWLFNILLFVTFVLMYAARWMMFFDEARRIFGHSTVSMFIGTIPMGLATIINGFLIFGLPRWGTDMVLVAQALWWIDVTIALACGVTIPYLMFTRQEHSIDQMTAVWLLPVVAAGVASVSGGLLAPHLAGSNAQFTVLVTSYVLWAYSVPIAMSILVILLLRMALYKLPHESMAASSCLSLGPVSTAGVGILVMGYEARRIFAWAGLADVGVVANGFGVIAGIMFWGLGLWWISMALLITIRYFRKRVPFNLGWWAFTFPLGVYSLLSLRLGKALASSFFSTVGAALTIVLAVLWIITFSKTVAGAWRGNLFVSPCIAGISSGAVPVVAGAATVPVATPSKTL